MIDGIVDAPVLVTSAPSPGGHLDLLANPREYDAIATWLARSGFLRWRRSWVRLDADPVRAVTLSATPGRLLGGHDSSALFEGTERIPGFSHLVLAAPAAVLLLAARDLVGRHGRVSPDVRRRLTEALQRDPGAWATAGQRAPATGLAGALPLLRRAFEAQQPLPSSARALGLAGVLCHAGPLGAKVAVLAWAVPRRRRMAIVSFSGLDGSGKSTQVTQLRDTLERLGIPAELQWAGFKTGSSVRAALPVLDRPSLVRRRGAPPTASTPERDPLVPATCLGHPLGQHLWTFTVVAVNAISLWRYVLTPRPEAEVVIFDRFSADSAVKLDFHYRCNRDFVMRWQRAVFAAVSPKADVGFLVAVPSEVAYARRQEQTSDELGVMARLYDKLAPRYGLVRLDGTEPSAQLSQRVFRAAWTRMR